jgi:hypothetical protein
MSALASVEWEVSPVLIAGLPSIPIAAQAVDAVIDLDQCEELRIAIVRLGILSESTTSGLIHSDDSKIDPSSSSSL